MRKLFIAAAASLLSIAAQASDLSWDAGNDVGGASVIYGEPETDNIWFNANCIASAKVVQVMITIDSKLLPKRVAPASESYTLVTKVGTEAFRLIGRVEPDELSSAHSFIVLITPDHPFLQKLARDSKSNITYGKIVIPLDTKSASGVARVIKSCG